MAGSSKKGSENTTTTNVRGKSKNVIQTKLEEKDIIIDNKAKNENKPIKPHNVSAKQEANLNKAAKKVFENDKSSLEHVEKAPVKLESCVKKDEKHKKQANVLSGKQETCIKTNKNVPVAKDEANVLSGKQETCIKTNKNVPVAKDEANVLSGKQETCIKTNKIVPVAKEEANVLSGKQETCVKTIKNVPVAKEEENVTKKQNKTRKSMQNEPKTNKSEENLNLKNEVVIGKQENKSSKNMSNATYETEKFDKLCSLVDKLKLKYKDQYSSNISFESKNIESQVNSIIIDDNSLLNGPNTSQDSVKTENLKLKKEKDLIKVKSVQVTNDSQLKVESNAMGEKSKADLKRERRELQEQQRASKEGAKTKAASPQKQEKEVKPATTKISKVTMDKKKQSKHLPLLDHLSSPYRDFNWAVESKIIHPAIRSAGLKMRYRIIDGCIARVLQTLSAIYHLIEDYQTPSSCDLSRDLGQKLITNVKFLETCRPMSEPINNSIRYVKHQISEISSDLPEGQAKEHLLDSVRVFIHQNITLASQAIVQNALEYIGAGDVILTYGFSALFMDTISTAVKTHERERIKIVVVDNQKNPTGINMLDSLVDLGVSVHYRIISDVPHIMKKCSKVIVEAEAVVLNGAVMGPCGLSGIILEASVHSVPVIVLTQTFKFCNIDLTDSLVVNELADVPHLTNLNEKVTPNCRETEEKSQESALSFVSLVYDVTPPSLINVLVTERNNFPTSVVPVIIRRNYSDIFGQE